jgi:ABC-type glutathione transport system ATPase component
VLLSAQAPIYTSICQNIPEEKTANALQRSLYMSSTSAASFKRSSPFVEQPEAKRWQKDPARQTYDNIVTRDSARAQFGDSIQHVEYHGTVHHYSDRAQATETTLRGSATRSEILQSLKFDEMSDRFSTINPAHMRTCHWLVEREEYKAWQDMAKSLEHSGLLWIKGKPGAGKSTLMKWAFQYAQKSHHEVGTIYCIYRFESALNYKR